MESIDSDEKIKKVVASIDLKTKKEQEKSSKEINGSQEETKRLANQRADFLLPASRISLEA